jgi:hypothetical protein
MRPPRATAIVEGAVQHREGAYDTANGREVGMRRVLWVLGFLALGVVLGFAVRAMWPNRTA